MACSRALGSAGSRMEISSAMMTITTRSSPSVNARVRARYFLAQPFRAGYLRSIFDMYNSRQSAGRGGYGMALELRLANGPPNLARFKISVSDQLRQKVWITG